MPMSFLRRSAPRAFGHLPPASFRSRQQVLAFHRASPAWYPRKDTQDRESINTESTEYSKSGSDAAAASATDSAAFDPKQTRPEQEHETAAQEAEAKGGSQTSNPLNVSPANQEVSKPRSPTEGGPEGSVGETAREETSDRKRTSGGGSAPKSGGGKSGGSGSGV